MPTHDLLRGRQVRVEDIPGEQPATVLLLLSNLNEAAYVLDRTGLVLGAYLSWRERLDPPDAVARLRRHQPVALTAWGWEDLALDLIPDLIELWRAGLEAE